MTIEGRSTPPLQPGRARTSPVRGWRLADVGVGVVLGLVCAGLSYGFMDAISAWWHGLVWLVAFGLNVLVARPLSATI